MDYCIKAIKYFDSHATEEYGEDAFEEYIENVLCNMPIEIAFANILQLEGWDDYPTMTEKEYAGYFSDDYDNFDDIVYESNGEYNGSDPHRQEFLDDFWYDNASDDE